MPKLIVLFFGSDSTIVRAAEAAAEGAKLVRFTEVDLRAAATSDTRHKPLGSVDLLSAYHGIVFIAGPREDASTDASRSREFDPSGPRLDDVLSHVAGAPGAADLVLGIVGGGQQDLARMARTGAIMIGTGSPADPGASDPGRLLDHAHAMGFRIAKVTGWVRHGLGHEAAHHHTSV